MNEAYCNSLHQSQLELGKKIGTKVVLKYRGFRLAKLEIYLKLNPCANHSCEIWRQKIKTDKLNSNERLLDTCINIIMKWS